MTGFRVVKAAALTVGIAVLCFLPPIVHFVTGPLSPLIGGYFAGNRYRLSGGEAAIVGLTLAIVVGVPVPWLFQALGEITIAPAALIFFSVFGALFLGLLGGVAAYVGGNSGRQQDMSEI